MLVLLIIVLILVLIVLAFLMAACFLLVKVSDQLGELWDEVASQKLNIGRLMNWAGGVPEEKQDQS